MVIKQIPRKQPTFGFHWVLADRLMMGLKVQHAPGHTWALQAWGWGLSHCLHRLPKWGRQKITSEAGWDPFCVPEKKKSIQNMGILNMLWQWCFANLISSLSFHIQILTNQASCFKCFDFCQQNPFQQNMVLSKHPQEDFMLSLVSVAQLLSQWKWDRKKKFSANLQLPGNCQDANPSTLKPPEWY